MSSRELENFLLRHRNYFRSAPTDQQNRERGSLITSRSLMKEHAEDFCAASWTDLRRSEIEALGLCEVHDQRDRPCARASPSLDDIVTHKHASRATAISGAGCDFIRWALG